MPVPISFKLGFWEGGEASTVLYLLSCMVLLLNHPSYSKEGDSVEVLLLTLPPLPPPPNVPTSQNTEIERMQRQFSEQHMTERKVSRQLEESQQRLLEMGSRVKEHAADIRGTRCRISRTMVHHGGMEEEEQVALPAIVQPPVPEEPPRLQ